MTGQAHWSLLLQARALDSQCMVLGAAQGGDHVYKNGKIRQTWGHATISAFDGTIIDSYDNSALAGQAADKDYALVLAMLDKPAQQLGRQKMPIFQCHRLA